MAIDFPSTPTIGDEHVEAGITWIWTGVVWDIVGDTNKPIHKIYNDLIGLIGDQLNQKSGFIYYVISEDTYYEYRGTTDELISDYNPIGGSGIITASNGLTKVSNDIQLGDTYITYNPNSDFNIIFSDSGSAQYAAQYLSIDTDNSYFGTELYNASGTLGSTFEHYTNNSFSGLRTWVLGNGSDLFQLEFQTNIGTGIFTAIITDEINEKGVEYGGDYESNFTARSLITRQFAEALVSSGSYIHPTYTLVSETLSGATVLATFETDVIGSVTGFTTRTLTASDISAYTQSEVDSLIAGIPTISASTGLEKIGNDIRLGVDNGVNRIIDFTNFGTNGSLLLNADRINTASTQSITTFNLFNSISDSISTENSYLLESTSVNGSNTTVVSFDTRTRYNDGFTWIKARTNTRSSVLEFNTAPAGVIADFYVNDFTGSSVFQKLSLSTQTTAVFEDSITSRGIVYAGDYEVNFLPRSLITKQYITGVGAGLLGGRGLFVSSGSLNVGDPYSGNPNQSYIRLEDYYSINQAIFGIIHEASIGGEYNYYALENSVTSSSNRLNAEAYYGDYSGYSIYASTSLTDSYIELNVYDVSEYNSATIKISSTDPNSITIIDDINTKGVVYNADYSTVGTLDPRWIPDWGAVQDAISGLPSPYTHPTYTPIDETLSGATVLATFETDVIGSVTGFTTRTLMASDISAYTQSEVDSLIAGIPTISASTGLEKIGNDIRLGNEVVGDSSQRYIDISEWELSDFSSLLITSDPDSWSIGSPDPNVNLYLDKHFSGLFNYLTDIRGSQISTEASDTDSVAQVSANSGGGVDYKTSSLRISSASGAIYDDQIFSKGIVYTSDYSAVGTLDPRWIPDWGAVQGAISGGSYTHPAYTPVSETLSGATVLASFTSDTIGSVTGFTTRTLTLGDLGGTTDHTALSNIGTNTHAQIDTHISDGTIHFTQASISITESQISDLGSYLESVDISDINATGTADGTTYLRGDGVWATLPSGGVTDHGALTGLSDDDHTQYHNDARGDARYSLLGHTHAIGTSTVLGFSKLFSDTVQSVAATVVSATASRTYGIQVNGSGQLVVNVPWVNTVYTHPTFTAFTPTLTGANVLASLTTNTNGHVTAITTRALTPADIGAVISTRNINAGSGLSGGGLLSSDVILTLGTPSTLTALTTNGITTSSHTHQITGFLATTRDLGVNLTQINGLNINADINANVYFGTAITNAPEGDRGVIVNYSFGNNARNIQTYTRDEVDDAFFYRRLLSGSGNWRRVASREWVTSNYQVAGNYFKRSYNTTDSTTITTSAVDLDTNPYSFLAVLTNISNKPSGTTSAGFISSSFASTGSGVQYYNDHNAADRFYFRHWSSGVNSGWYQVASREWVTANYQSLLTNPVTGTGVVNQIAYWNGTGTITSREVYITNTTTQDLLEDTANWDIDGVYTGTAITGTTQGQKHYDTAYFFEAVDSNLWIRLARV